MNTHVKIISQHDSVAVFAYRQKFFYMIFYMMISCACCMIDRLMFMSCLNGLMFRIGLIKASLELSLGVVCTVCYKLIFSQIKCMFLSLPHVAASFTKYLGKKQNNNASVECFDNPKCWCTMYIVHMWCDLEKSVWNRTCDIFSFLFNWSAYLERYILLETPPELDQ